MNNTAGSPATPIGGTGTVPGAGESEIFDRKLLNEGREADNRQKLLAGAAGTVPGAAGAVPGTTGTVPGAAGTPDAGAG